MTGREVWSNIAREMWQPLRIASEEKQTLQLAVCRKNGDLVAKSSFKCNKDFIEYFRVHGYPAVVVGIDIREWSRRDFAIQSLMTVNLHKNIKTTLDHLRKSGLINFHDPMSIQYTGDGAILIFGGELSENPGARSIDCKKEPKYTCLDSDPNLDLNVCMIKPASFDSDLQSIFGALSFVFSFNALSQWDNIGQKYIHASGATREHSYAPLYLRYAISTGNVFPVLDAFDQLQFVGAPLVTCSRILSTDHGNHFLVDARLLHEMNKYGGISKIGTGHPSTCWDQELIISEFPEKQVKTGYFRYADIFGHHSDKPLLQSLGKTTITPGRFQIGSHDTRVVD